MSKIPIKCRDDQSLAALIHQAGREPFRRDQILDWLYRKWATDFQEMTNIPMNLRDQLAADHTAFSLALVTSSRDPDGTEKFLFQLAGGETIETVIIPAGRRLTVCISTQVGCPVRCAFCASGRRGLVRNLNRAEIIDQIIYASRHLGQRVTNVVVMGMGEPLLNLENLMPAIDLACDERKLGISARRITISTSGIPPGIRALADARRPWNLALSLHAVTDEKRAAIIPPAYRASIHDIIEACLYYRRQTSRMVTFEYTLMRNFNDSTQDAIGLAGLARKTHAKINLIACNPVTAKHQAPSAAAVQAFANRVAASGAQITIRQSKGSQINAACGQLRHKLSAPHRLSAEHQIPNLIVIE